jgi:AsmA protein
MGGHRVAARGAGSQLVGRGDDPVPDDKLESSAKGKHRKLWIGLAIAVGALIVLSVVAGVVVSHSNVVAQQVQSRVLPHISQQLGRQVTIQELEVSIFPRTTAHIIGLQVAGVGGGPPLVEAPSADLTVKLLPLLLSLGKDVQLGSLTLRRPVVNLARGANGAWGHQGLTPPKSRREVLIESLRVEDGTLRLIDLSGRGQQMAAALTRIDARAKNLSRDKPFSLDMVASLASESQNVRARLSGDLQKGIKGTVSASAVSLAAIRDILPAGLGTLLRDGTLSLDTKLAGRKGSPLQATGTASIDRISLRGSMADAKAAFHVASTSGAKGLAVVIDRFSILGESIDMGGTGNMTLQPLAGRLDLKGSRLDLQALLGAVPSQEKAPGAPLIPEPMRQHLQQAAFQATLAVDRVTSGKLVASGLAAQANLAGGVLEVVSANADLWGGKARLDGGRIDLRPAVPEWSLGASLHQADIGQAMRELSGQELLKGLFDVRLALHGAGIDWRQVSKTAKGNGSLTMKDGSLNTIDLGEEAARGLAGAFGRHLGVPPNIELPGTTTALRNVHTTFTVSSGFIHTKTPIELDSDFGHASLSGEIGLDKTLDLTGTVGLSSKFVSQITGGRVHPTSIVKVPISIHGDLSKPKPQIEPKGLLRSLISSPGGGARRLLDDALPDPPAASAPKGSD